VEKNSATNVARLSTAAKLAGAPIVYVMRRTPMKGKENWMKTVRMVRMENGLNIGRLSMLTDGYAVCTN
jgi:hypothetical protein